jgi:signal transduction histidine kinase
MNDTKDRFGYESLAFFGRVNASISHELKNVMAIISETAGLLSDLSEMASSGAPVAPDMLKDCTLSIVEEIQRGFSVIRQMNRFSHSIDHPVESVDLMEVLDLSVNLSGYLSFAGKVDIRPYDGPAPMVVTCPFLLQAVVYRTLADAFKIIGTGSEVTISVAGSTDEKGWKILFSNFGPGEFQGFPDAGLNTMAASIGVAIDCDSRANRLEIFVPMTIDKGSLSES